MQWANQDLWQKSAGMLLLPVNKKQRLGVRKAFQCYTLEIKDIKALKCDICVIQGFSRQLLHQLTFGDTLIKAIILLLGNEYLPS